jgi:hypothetical protein
VGRLCGKIGGKMMRKVGIKDLTKEDKLIIEKYGEEHLDLRCNWIDDRYCNKILYKNIAIKLVPTIREHSTHLDCSEVIGADLRKQTSSSKTFYKTAVNPMEALKKAILEQVSCDITSDGDFFSKADVINWFEANIATDPNFPYRLNEDFVSDFKRRSKDFLSYDDLRKNYDKIATESEFLRNENKQLEEENMLLKEKVTTLECYGNKEAFFKTMAVRIKNDAVKNAVNVDIPLTIYSIACCLDIEIYKDKNNPKTTYNEGGKNGTYYYGTIEKYISNDIPKGINGGKGKMLTDSNKLKLKEMLSTGDYDLLRDIFLKSKFHEF